MCLNELIQLTIYLFLVTSDDASKCTITFAEQATSCLPTYSLWLAMHELGLLLN